MSEALLRFISSDPQWSPSPAAVEAAKALLRTMLPKAETIDATFSDTTTFYDPGQNWSGVECDQCGADADGWWGDAVDVAARSGFTDLHTAAPCCGAKVSLNDLHYVWPAGFGRFALEAMNPDADTTADQEQALSQCLGTGLRKIWVGI